MPLPRTPRAPLPPPQPIPSLEALVDKVIRRCQVRWREAVRKESWRLVHADGLRAAGPAEWARGEQSLRDQGLAPPSWLLDWPAPGPAATGAHRALLTRIGLADLLEADRPPALRR